MGQLLKVELLNEAARAVESMAAITGRKTDQVVSDALRTYLWILREQTEGRTVVSQNGGPENEVKMTNLVSDEKAARHYFKEVLHW